MKHLLLAVWNHEKLMCYWIIKHQRPDIDKIHFYVKDPFEWNYQLLINEREEVGIENLKNPRTFTYYWQTIDDIYENLED